MGKYIDIIDFETDEVVMRINVTGKSDRTIDKIDDGLNINLNHDKFYTIVENSEF